MILHSVIIISLCEMNNSEIKTNSREKELLTLILLEEEMKKPKEFYGFLPNIDHINKLRKNYKNRNHEHYYTTQSTAC